MTAPEVHEALAEVLAAHEMNRGPVSGAWICGCGVRSKNGSLHDGNLTTFAERQAQLRAHLASVLADHFAEAVTEARADGETEWGVRYQNLYDESVYIARGGEASARAALVGVHVLVRRTVTPWARADSLAPEAPSEVQR